MKKIDTFKAFTTAMKTMLAVVCTMLLLVGNLRADEITYIFSEQGFENGTELGSGTINDYITYTTASNDASNLPKYYTSGTAARFYAYYSTGNGNSMTLVPGAGYIITGVQIYAVSTYNPIVNYSVDNGDEVSIEATDNVYTISNINAAAALMFKNSITTDNKQLRITQLVITYTQGTPTAATPQFTPAAGTLYEATDIAITCATEGAAIYYTLDGSVPDSLTATLYTAPINISANTTVKAIAYAANVEASAIATAEYLFPTTLENIAAFQSATPGVTYKIENVTFVYRNETYIYVKDATGGLLIYDDYTPVITTEYQSGDVIPAVYGTYTLYNGLTEMKPIRNTEAATSNTGEVLPVEVTLADIAANYEQYESMFVRVIGVTCAGRTFNSGSASNMNITQDVTTLAVRSAFKNIDLTVPANYEANICAFVARYNTTVQMYLPSADAIVPATIVMPATIDFEMAMGMQLFNGEQTNKWYLGQAQGFDNNKLYISSTNGATNKYNVTAASVVHAAREVVIPANGAILSFDYKVVGESADYLQVAIVDAGTELTAGTNVADYIVRLYNQPTYTQFSYNIPATLAGNKILVFTWVNNNTGGTQTPASVDNISLIESSCVMPTGLTVTTNQDAATVVWTAPADQTAWTLEYKLTDHSIWYSMNVTGTPTANLVNLQGNSTYNIRVKAVCDDMVSAWEEGTFNVECLTQTTTTEEITIGTATSTNSYLFPGFYGWQYVALLYDMTQYGNINSISYYLNSSSSSTGSTMEVWVKAVDADFALAASNTFSSFIDGAQLIYSGQPNFTSSGWIEFPISGGFTLPDGDDLLVLVRGVGCSTGGGCSKAARYTTASGKMWYKLQDSSDPGMAVRGTISYYRYNVQIDLDIISCGDQISCVKPTNLAVSNINAFTADVTWTAGSTETAWLFEYKTAAETDWTSVQVTDANYTLTGLTKLTDYQVRVRAICDEMDESEPVTPVSFTTLATCFAPTNISHSNSSTTTILSWYQGGTEEHYIVEFKQLAQDESAFVSIPVDFSTTTAFGGLTPNTQYIARIKSICDEATGDVSDWVYYNFLSGCAPVDITFDEDFAASSVPDCWTNNGFMFQSGLAVASLSGDMLITPALNIPATGTTYIKYNVGTAVEQSDYQVALSFRGTAADNFTVIYNGTTQGTMSAPETKQLEIPQSYMGQPIYVAFINGENNFVGFDNLVVTQCPAIPTDLTAANVTPFSVDLAWTVDASATQFVVEYTTDRVNWISEIVTANPYTLTNLVPETSYAIRVATNCGTDNNSLYTNTVSITTPPTCPQPTALEAANITGSTVDLTWTAGGSETTWNLEYGHAGFEQGTGVMVVLTANTYSLVGLNPVTTYDVYVQADCGTEDGASYWTQIDFTTTCGVLSAPFVETFEINSTSLQCWEVINNNNDDNLWEVSTSYPYSGSRSVKIYTDYNSGNNDDYLITPAIALTGNQYLSYYYKVHSSSEPNDMEVLLSTTGTQPANFNTTLMSLTSMSNTTYAENIIDLRNYTGTVYIAFHVPAGGLDGWNLYLDEISILDYSTCPAPTALTITNATLTQIDFSWTAGGSENAWNIEYGVSGFELGTGITQTATTNSASITGLTANTTYDIYVQANCGNDDVSTWVGPLSAIAAPVYSFPTTGTVALTTCEMTLYDDGGAEGSYSSGCDATVIIQPATSGAMVQISGTCASETNYDKLYIYDGAGTSGTLLQTCSNSTGVQVGPFTSTSGPLTVRFTSDVSVVFSGFELAVSCQLPLPCATPTNLVVSNISGNAADVTWTAGGSETAWNLEYGTAGFEQGTGIVVPLTSNSYSLTGLNAAISYDVYVQADCGSTDGTSFWTSVDFTTACGIMSLPFSENFDNYSSSTTLSSSTMPNCWIRDFTGTSTSYNAGIYPSTTYSYSGANSLRFYNYCSSANQSSAIYGDIYAVLPMLDVANPNMLQIDFFARNYSTTTTYNSEIVIGVVTDINDLEGTFTPVVTVNPASSTYSHYIVDLASYTGLNGNITFYMQRPNGTPAYNYVYLDDLYIDLIPSCPAPQNVIVSNVVGNSADVSWTANSNATVWNVEYGPAGFAQGTGTVINVTTNPCTLTGLSNSIQYDVYVQADCGNDDLSDWSEATTFASACGNTTVPYFENFDNYSSSTTVSSSTMPACWERDFTGTYTSYNAGIYPSTSYSQSGNNSLRFYNYCTASDQSNTSYGDIYAIMPMMDVANPNLLQVAFSARNYSTSTSYNSEIVIGVTTDLEDIAGTFTPVATVRPISTTYADYAVSLVAYSGENGYITFYMQRPDGSPSYNYIYIDDLTIDYTYTDVELTSMEVSPYLCDLSGQEIALTVTNYNPFADLTTFDVTYVINDGTPVTETVTLTTPLAVRESYIFTTIPTYAAVNNFVAWITCAGNEDPANDTLTAFTSQIDPFTVPYTENFSNVVINHGWNQVDANNDDIMMNIENGKITYTYNDELAANDWLMSPCFDLTAGKYEIAYDYNALSLLQEGFAVYYGTAANVAAMTELIASHTDFVQTGNAVSAKTIITIPQDGTFNFGFLATSLAGNMGFTIDNFTITPVIDLLVTYGANGIIMPNGLVEVRHNETHLFSIYPNDGYHIKGIYVNDVLVRDEDMQNARFELFTYGPVTEPATIHVDFEISQYYINATVTNADIYTDYNNNVIGATFAPVPDTIMFGDPYTGILTLAPNFHLYSAISNNNDVMSQMVQIDDHHYSFTIDRVMENKNLAFVVEIDTIAIVYNILGGQGYCDASGLLVENDVYSTWINYNYDLVSNIVPATGYHIESVTVNGIYLASIANYSFVNVTETQYVDVVFAKNTYTITTTAIGNGTITDGITFEYDPAFVYNYDVTPAIGYYIASLEINGVAVDITDPEVTYTSSMASISQDYTIIATFQPLAYTIDATAQVGGTITPSGELLYNYNANQTFAITPNAGYQIADVVVDGESQGALTSYTFNSIVANHTINVSFATISYTISATAGNGGTITPSGDATVVYGGEQTYTISANEGYYIVDVLVDNVTMGPISTYTFANVEANHTISVSFAQYDYTIIASINGNGTISPLGSTTVVYGGTQAYAIAANTGYEIVDVLVDGVSQGIISSYTFNNVVENHTIAAVTAIQEFTVTVNQPANGVVTPAGIHTVVYGATPSFTVTPNAGYEINTILVDGQTVTFTADAFGATTITVPAVTADVTVTATMTQLTYTITATAGANGTISPVGTSTVAYGASQTYAIAPATGYQISTVAIDGITIGAIASFTFTNVMENHTIAATFELIECVAPINTYISNLDETSVTLNWNNTGAATYSVHYKALADANYTEINNIAATFVDVTGLQKGTAYIWNVKANCSSTNVSDWSYERTFTTPDYTVCEDTTVIGIHENALSAVQVYSHINNIFIINNEGVDIESIAVYDMYGKLVYSGEVVDNPTVISLNVATGIYMVKLETEFGVTTRKVHITK